MKTNITFTPAFKPVSDGEKLYADYRKRDQGWEEILEDENLINKIEAFAKQVKGKYKHVVNIGIGGSALGAQAIRDSLLPYGAKDAPSLHIMDNIDPICLQDLLARINIEDTLFLVITKSGGTAETLSLYSFFKEMLEQAGHKPQNHIVFITDPVDSYLRDVGNTEGYTMFPIPPKVGGRFSVLSAVGLVPAALIGVDIKGLIKGAKTMQKSFSGGTEENLPLAMAEFVHDGYKKGRNMLVTMPYAERLKTFGEWVGQLVAESTGKINNKGKNVGISPVSALGVTDQHSQLQLYAQGADQRTFIFISESENDLNYEIPSLGTHKKVKYLNGKTFKELLHAEKDATIKTLQELGRPTVEIKIPKLNEETLGELFFLYEGMTAFLGEMMSINAFDQPGVERSKVLTKEYLKK